MRYLSRRGGGGGRPEVFRLIMLRSVDGPYAVARQRCGETLNEQAGEEDGRELEAEKKEGTEGGRTGSRNRYLRLLSFL